MPAKSVSTWGDVRGQLAMTLGGSRALEQIERLQSWCRDELEFGVVLWRRGYFNAALVARDRLHDLEFQVDGTFAVRSAPVRDMTRLIVVEEDPEGLPTVHVSAMGGDPHFFWTAADGDSRSAVLQLATRLRELSSSS